jgi:hypothetical protein
MTPTEQYETLLVSAYERGVSQGTNDRLTGLHNDSPLSGEWSGESIPELLGDLIKKAEKINGVPDNSGRLWQEICDNYETGYYEGNTE